MLARPRRRSAPSAIEVDVLDHHHRRLERAAHRGGAAERHGRLPRQQQRGALGHPVAEVHHRERLARAGRPVQEQPALQVAPGVQQGRRPLGDAGVTLDGVEVWRRPRRKGVRLVRISTLLEAKGDAVATVAPGATVGDVVAQGWPKSTASGPSSSPTTAAPSPASCPSATSSASSTKHGPSVLDVPVADVMTAQVHTCQPGDGVDELMALMTERRIRHVPVVVDGKLAGIVSIGDVVKSRLGELESRELRDHRVHPDRPRGRLAGAHGSNQQNWAFVVVTDAAKRATIADYYRQGGEMLAGMGYPPPLPEGDPRIPVQTRVIDSAMYLAERLEQVPVFVIPCVQGRVETDADGAGPGFRLRIDPAGGVVVHARGPGPWPRECVDDDPPLLRKEIAAVLGIPDDWTQAALLPSPPTPATTSGRPSDRPPRH